MTADAEGAAVGPHGEVGTVGAHSEARTTGARGDIIVRLLAACEEFADRPAITGADGTTWTFKSLGIRIRNTAAALRDRGFSPGDRVQFSIRPQPRGIVFALGVVAAGGVIAFADLGVAEDVFAARRRRIGPNHVAAESVLYSAGLPGVRRIARRAGILLPGLREHTGGHFHAGPRLPGMPRHSADVEALAARIGKIEVGAEPDRLCLLVSTSGTTAHPRIVAHSRGSLDAAMQLFSGAVDIAPGERVHSDQFFLGLAALCAGAHWSMPAAAAPPRKDPAGFVRGLRGAQVSFLVPADVELVTDAIAAGAPDPRLRSIIVGAAPVTASLLDTVAQTMPRTRVLATYGMTEVLPIAVTDAADKLAHPGPGDYVGRLLPGVEARVVRGRLALRGPNMMVGYLDAEGEPTTEAISEGAPRAEAGAEGEPTTEAGAGHEAHTPHFDGTWLLTTDLAELLPAAPGGATPRTTATPRTPGSPGGTPEPSGASAGSHRPGVVLLGRSGDMIIRGSTNIYPGLYEPALAAHPAISHAVLVGISDDFGDERVVAVVVPRTHESAGGTVRLPEIAEALRTRIDHDAQPDALVLLPALPTSGRSAKLDRPAVRRAVAGLLGLVPTTWVGAGASALPVYSELDTDEG
ncbi:hypothetical protein GCM10022261_09720 [Brevibacterium daeguense]|uniref:Acyl-CoA synthetase (AMP-forming)/AMP-acid ligase II n=1 Tax=Brevibacterium daeguense TaxID=909936 RepID=A0ABP8EHU1_9MICO|nr:class I adenylate-forming enzyme family protein [Brevibacterium daeguense]